MPAPKPKDPLPKGEGLNMGDVLDMTPKKKSATCGRRRTWSTKKRNTLQPDLPPPPPPPSGDYPPKAYLMKGRWLYNYRVILLRSKWVCNCRVIPLVHIIVAL